MLDKSWNVRRTPILRHVILILSMNFKIAAATFCEELNPPTLTNFHETISQSFGYVAFCPFTISGNNCDADQPFKSNEYFLNLVCSSVLGDQRGCTIDCPGSHFEVELGKTMYIDSFSFQSATTSSIVVNSGGTLVLTNNKFEGNIAEEGVVGGAVRAESGSGVELYYNQFNNNEAKKGGALHLECTSARIYGCTFVQNKAEEGGGIYTGALANRIIVGQNTFAANHASSQGPAVALGGYNVNFLKGSNTACDHEQCNGVWRANDLTCDEFQFQCLSPTVAPTKEPSPPTSSPTTSSPTKGPTSSPSLSSKPTETKSASPTLSPSLGPTSSPTLSPTHQPSVPPTVHASVSPTSPPSQAPTYLPSSTPSQPPSAMPSSSLGPTVLPTQKPSNSPSSAATVSPTSLPSANDTQSPSSSPSLRGNGSNPTSSNPTTTSLEPSGSPTILLHSTKMPSTQPTFHGSEETSSPTPYKFISLTPTIESIPSYGPSERPSAVLMDTQEPSEVPTRSNSTFPSASPTSTRSPSPSIRGTSTKAPSSSPEPSYSSSTKPTSSSTVTSSFTPSYRRTLSPSISEGSTKAPIPPVFYSSPSPSLSPRPSYLPSTGPTSPIIAIPSSRPTYVSLSPSISRGSTKPPVPPVFYSPDTPLATPTRGNSTLPSFQPSKTSLAPRSITQPLTKPSSKIPRVHPSTKPSALQDDSSVLPINANSSTQRRSQQKRMRSSRYIRIVQRRKHLSS